jgi:hypothetical protein
MVGQVDLLMRNEDLLANTTSLITTHKEPAERKSYYNRFTRKYKMMSGPFSIDGHNHLTASSRDIQVSEGRRWQEGENKTTYGCYPEGYELVHNDPR